ncbi:MAG: helix-turn-helix domain-containing transcriptional regulator [Halothiobacillus sp.]
MTEKSSHCDSTDYLKTDEDINAYFEVCVGGDPGDGSLIRHALGTIARARGMMQFDKAADWCVKSYSKHFLPGAA